MPIHPHRPSHTATPVASGRPWRYPRLASPSCWRRAEAPQATRRAPRPSPSRAARSRAPTARRSRHRVLKGTWSFRFADGRDSQLLNGNEVANGTYTISGSTVKFADPAIPKGAVPPSSSGTSTTPPAGAPAGAPSLPSGTTSPTACKTPGTYKVTISGETLTFKKISDPCNAPRAQLLSHKFTKA